MGKWFHQYGLEGVDFGHPGTKDHIISVTPKFAFYLHVNPWQSFWISGYNFGFAKQAGMANYEKEVLDTVDDKKVSYKCLKFEFYGTPMQEWAISKVNDVEIEYVDTPDTLKGNGCMFNLIKRINDFYFDSSTSPTGAKCISQVRHNDEKWKYNINTDAWDYYKNDVFIKTLKY